MQKNQRAAGATAGRKRSRGQPLVARGPPHGSEDFPVVGMGASSGGLEACNQLLGALPPDNGMAFILVQHLDPTHTSMMAELLAHRTAMTVVQAANGMPLERQHLYVIPPGTYLSVSNGALHLSEPEARHGARMPFDFLLRSLAEEYGERAICVVLSGTGADGSLGLKAVKEKGGLVIAQNPDEAAFDGMPRNAILTGAVDLVLPLRSIPDALIKFYRRMALTRGAASVADGDAAPDWLPEIVDLLRKNTAHDFRLYKEGTLRRRIERRMAMASIETDDMERYLDALRKDEKELNRLASDLLINVTSFFRDPRIFDVLSKKIVPDLVRSHSIDQPLRIWIAGCSTGEETYSLAILFREEITAAKREIKLQIFASDVDPDAVATAREGLYPATIAAEVSAARLTHFFSKDEHGYRILPELRATIVFAVQDVLTDPPFSHLELISCRNLLIYLRPEAQEKVISFFHFALREGGILLLGSAETIGNSKGRFEVISKADRIYRHIGRARPGEAGFLFGSGEGARPSARAPQSPTPSRQAALADGCRRLIVETYAPAAVLINSKLGWLYSLGPTERYLRVPQGPPSYDLLTMVRPHLRIKLRAAIHHAIQEKARIVIPGGRTNHEGKPGSFEIAVQPALIEGQDLLLVCFIESPATVHKRSRMVAPPDRAYVAELEQQLEATRTELQAAIHSLETSNEEQKAVNEEALSANEEYQSTNEELLTSKEELQSMNEELTALNSQLQETLERQRTTANDLQNILYSTNVATIFLDLDLDIRFFTPATKALFNIIPSDIGRPLADLNTLLDINQLEAGTVHPEFASFPIDDILERLRDEFSYHATAQKLSLRVVPCSLSVYSDPRLLEQMVRNLLSNALKYTKRGKVLLGCRRHGEMLRIEVCDTGVGIAGQDLEAIFDEYHQLDNPARERSRGLGLGLSIVQRLTTLLGCSVHVHSRPGKGSIFSIDVMLSPDLSHAEALPNAASGPRNDGDKHTGAILIIEDDRELRELLEMALKEEGHRPVTAPDGPAALELVVHSGFQPDLVLADYNLPNGMDGILVATKMRAALYRYLPVIVLTGDISMDALRRIASQDCVQLNKPVKTTDVLQAIQRLLSVVQPALRPPPARRVGVALHSGAPVIFVVDDDSHVRDGIRDLLEADGQVVEDFESCEAFLQAYRPGQAGCLLVDAYLPGMTGLELLQRLHDAGDRFPAIMITGNSDVPMAVQAMKAGARDFIEKPIGREELLAGVERALEQARDAAKLSAWQKAATDHIANLTPRQRQIMDLVLVGHPSKNIAADLNISRRTVENHRAAIMKKTGAKSLPALARLALAAAFGKPP